MSQMENEAQHLCQNMDCKPIGEPNPPHLHKICTRFGVWSIRTLKFVARNCWKRDSPRVNCISLYNSLRLIFVCGLEVSKVLHEPQLDTILMVEKAIRDAQEYPSRMELWRSLPRKIQYQTFKRVLEYLEASNKIVFNRGRVVWAAADNPKLKRLLEESVKVR